MARVSPMLTGSEVEVRVGDQTVMFGQNFTYQDSMQNFQPMGLGEFAAKANEPLFYNGGSITMSLLRYSDAIFALDGATLSGKKVQATVNKGTNKIVSSENKEATDGNSLAEVNFMSPAAMLFERTVDIVAYAKEGDVRGAPILKATGCRLQAFNSGHTAGGPSSEQYTFRVHILSNVPEEPDKEQNNA
jgi:hypothetical protein